MKLIESKVEYLHQDKGLEGVYKQIEKCGRVSYKSEDKITKDSAEPFVKRIIDSHHYAVLECGTVYLALPMESIIPIEANGWGKYYKNPYSKSGIVCEVNGEEKIAVVTNYRVLQENDWLDDLQYFCSPTEFHEKRYSIKFTCSRAIANELIRHRAFSFMQESQRFVNYSKEKFGNEITFIEPSWNYKYNDNKFEGAEDWNPYMRALYQAESSYFEMIGDGCTPQQARDVLPNATKTELIMTGFASDWRYLLDLRLFGKTGSPHPDMVDLMEKLQKVAEEAGIWDDIMKYPSKFG